MGRYITVNEENIWKYALAMQDSEQCRIHKELGLGEYSDTVYYQADEVYTQEEIEDLKKQGRITSDGMIEQHMDRMTLTMKDVPELEEYLTEKGFLKLKVQYKNLFAEYGPMEHAWIEMNSPLYFALEQFVRSTDYYFLAMIEAFIIYMKKANEEKGTEVFQFEGEK